MRTFIIIMMALLVPSLSISAQRRAKKANPKKETVDPRIERMVAATQDVIFIDSIVVNKNEFLNLYNMNPESGTLLRYNDFFDDVIQSDAIVHVNEMGNKCYYSTTDTVNGGRLFTRDMFDDKWTVGSELKGIRDGERLSSLNYPFMMADGTTLYFAAKGTESIGGYDIFVTRLDLESGRCLKPENIGMPFNSTANDYMYAIDELDSIGWFVTDRNQPSDKVCIYLFIPSETRQTYPSDGYTTEQLAQLSNISRISATWKDGKARVKALGRLRKIAENKAAKKKNGGFEFVINNNTTYHSLSDFRSAENANKFAELTTLKAKKENLYKVLDKAREYYATAGLHEKVELGNEILKSEKQYESMVLQIETLEKEIRNSENTF